MRGESEQKAAKGSGGLNFQTVHRAWERRALWVAPARRDRWIKNNGNAESSVARLLLRRLFSIAENNKKKKKEKKCINRTARSRRRWHTNVADTANQKRRPARNYRTSVPSIYSISYYALRVFKSEIQSFTYFFFFLSANDTRASNLSHTDVIFLIRQCELKNSASSILRILPYSISFKTREEIKVFRCVRYIVCNKRRALAGINSITMTIITRRGKEFRHKLR